MPFEIMIFIGLIFIICVFFLIFKMPMYECMFFGFIFLLIITNKWGSALKYIQGAFCNTLFYAIILFLLLSKILETTHAVDAITNIIIATLGRFPGGAAYTAVFASCFMGAVSGSGAGNVATTGTFTIPAMIKTGVPKHLAANIESASSTMGNMIPPSANIVVALATYNEFVEGNSSQSKFWLVVWGIALWFIIQRVITVFCFCKYYNVKSMNKEDIPKLNILIEKEWKNLLLPVVILLPFVLDYFFKNNFFIPVFGDFAKFISSNLLIITPIIAAVYAILINIHKFSFGDLKKSISSGSKGIISIALTIFIAYCISNLFSDIGFGNVVGEYMKMFHLNKISIAIILPLICAILGMVIPGSAQTKIFGGTLLTVYSSYGGNPLLAAAMLPAITGAMEGITPPLALCTYTAMGIAKANMKDTLLNNFFWVALHYIMSVLCLIGLLPILGL